MGLRQVLPVQTNSRVFMREKNQTSNGVASRSPVNADVGDGNFPTQSVTCVASVGEEA
jgi:hypothetical protein